MRFAYVVALAAFVLAACQGSGSPAMSQPPDAEAADESLVAEGEAPETAEFDSADSPDVASSERLRQLFDNDQLLDELLANPLGLNAPDTQAAPEALPRTGSWMNCDGYLTRNADQGYCEESPPESWTPFEFEGQRYFIVPLG